MTAEQSRQFRWWHGLAFYAVVQVASLGLRAAARLHAHTRAVQNDRTLYEAERLPVFAPPGAAFPIAWGINTVSLIAGGLHVLNLPHGTPGRAQYLRSQAIAWVLFALFSPAYFDLESPINAEAVTLLYTAATAVSLEAALRKIPGPRAALSLVTTLAWLALANPVGAAQAAWNYDRFWKIGPLAEPRAGWAKNAKAY